MDGTVVNNWDTAGNGSSNPIGITTDGNYIWTIDSGGDEVYKWDMEGRYVTNWDINAAGNTNPVGITINGTNIWTSDSNEKVFKWLIGGPNRKISQNTLSNGQSVSFNWTVNATGAVGTNYEVDVLASSDTYNSSVPDAGTFSYRALLFPTGVPRDFALRYKHTHQKAAH